ncbi:MAG: hypothetical protein J5855_09950 [Mailhella sp.]|nr:hypothetical protein [Mailhella sp.]
MDGIELLRRKRPNLGFPHSCGYTLYRRVDREGPVVVLERRKAVRSRSG